MFFEGAFLEGRGPCGLRCWGFQSPVNRSLRPPPPLSYAPPHQVKVPVSRMVALLDRQEAATRVAPRQRAPPPRPATKVGVAEAAVATRAFLKAKGPPYLAGRGGVLASAAIYIPQF